MNTKNETPEKRKKKKCRKPPTEKAMQMHMCIQEKIDLLLTIIDKELAKPEEETDFALVKTCLRQLEALGGEKRTVSEEALSAGLQKIYEKAGKSPEDLPKKSTRGHNNAAPARRKTVGKLLKIAAVAAALLLTAFCSVTVITGVDGYDNPMDWVDYHWNEILKPDPGTPNSAKDDAPDKAPNAAKDDTSSQSQKKELRGAGVVSVSYSMGRESTIPESVWNMFTETVRWKTINGSIFDVVFDVDLSAFVYTKNDDGKSCAVTRVIGVDEMRLLAIPKEIDGLAVTALADGCFRETNIQVVIAESIEKIGAKAFMDCKKLWFADFDQNIREVGDYAFAGCNELRMEGLPSGYTSIGDYAFRDCYSLKRISLSKCLTHLGKGAFKDCKGLDEVVLQGGERRADGECVIPAGTFENCSMLTSVIINGDVTVVETDAFIRCSENIDDDYVTVFFAPGVKEIGLQYIYSIVYNVVYIPDTVEKMEELCPHVMYYGGSKEEFKKLTADWEHLPPRVVYDFDYPLVPCC